jgi:hypothetical protein
MGCLLSTLVTMPGGDGRADAWFSVSLTLTTCDRSELAFHSLIKGEAGHGRSGSSTLRRWAGVPRFL